MAPTKVLNCSHGQALSFEHIQWVQLAEGRALHEFTPSESLKRKAHSLKQIVLYPTKILLEVKCARPRFFRKLRTVVSSIELYLIPVNQNYWPATILS